MKQDERQLLTSERTEIEERLKCDFPNPKDVRRLDAIRDLLLTDGKCNDLQLKFGKPRKSERVTSFTRDRR